MKKIVSIVLALVMALSLCVTTTWAVDADTSWYTGAATDATAYTISDAADLLGLADLVNGGNTFEGKTIKLDADIDLSDIANWTPIGDVSDTTKQFKGEFNGNSKTISNMTMTGGARMGLFSMPTCAYIHDFTLSNVNFSTSADDVRVGAVAANLQHWNVVENVTVNGVTIDVTGGNGLIGGAVGFMWKSQMGNVDVKNVIITATGNDNIVSGHTALGSAHIWDTDVSSKNAHWLDGTTFGTSVVQNLFLNCDVEGADINMNGTGGVVGGFFGHDTYNNHSNYFKNCKVTSLDIACQNTGSFTAGGFVGFNQGSNTASVGCPVTEKGFDGCSASGMISGGAGTYGGFAGSCGGRLHAYENATANVSITSAGVAGGFVGATANYFDHAYTFDGCDATGNVFGTTAGGFAGSIGHGGDGSALNVTINGCTATGNVSGTANAGGLVGTVNDKKGETPTGSGSVTVKGSSASGAVTGANKGGAIGSTNVEKTSVTLNGNNNSTDVNDLVGSQENNSTVHAIDLDCTAVTMAPNDTLTLNATYYPTEGYAVQWESSDETVATVDANGVVTAVSDGSAIITAKLVSTAYTIVDTNDSTNVATQALTNGEQTPEQTVYATATCAVTVETPETPAHSHTRRQPTTTTTEVAPDTTKTDVVTSAKTFDAGIAVYAAMGVLSLTGSAWVVGKKRG